MIKNYVIKIAVAALTAVFAATCFSGCSQNSNSTSTVSDQTETIVANGSQMRSLGEFSTIDINDEKVTQDIFMDNKLTLVNVLSVTCDPCMEELPYLAELAKEYRDKNIGFLGVSIDMDSEGNPDKSTKEDFKKLIGENAENINIAYLDVDLMTKIFSETDAIPHTFFVDENGTIVGERYTGSHSKEEWKGIIDKEIKNAGV